jgi:hypothetical protein
MIIHTHCGCALQLPSPKCASQTPWLVSALPYNSTHKATSCCFQPPPKLTLDVLWGRFNAPQLQQPSQQRAVGLGGAAQRQILQHLHLCATKLCPPDSKVHAVTLRKGCGGSQKREAGGGGGEPGGGRLNI